MAYLQSRRVHGIQHGSSLQSATRHHQGLHNQRFQCKFDWPILQTTDASASEMNETIREVGLRFSTCQMHRA
eukprot:768737-Hanusia_phi.AAC.3